jgi:hypothetical protein
VTQSPAVCNHLAYFSRIFDFQETIMTTTASLYENVNRQVEKAADIMGLDADIRQILTRPTNEIVVHFPVKLGSGRIETSLSPIGKSRRGSGPGGLDDLEDGHCRHPLRRGEGRHTV